MFDVKRVWSRGRNFKELTGLTLEEGKVLLDIFTMVYDQWVVEKHTDPMGNVNMKGSATKYDPSALLFLILFYFRHYPKYSVLELIFEMHQQNLCTWIKDLKALMIKVLEHCDVLPKSGINSESEFLDLFKKGAKIYLDGTEQPIQRPKNPEFQTACYSGKKKTYDKNRCNI